MLGSRWGSAPSGNSRSASRGVSKEPWLVVTVSPADRGRRGHGWEDKGWWPLLGEGREPLALFLEAPLPPRLSPGPHNSKDKWWLSSLS